MTLVTLLVVRTYVFNRGTRYKQWEFLGKCTMYFSKLVSSLYVWKESRSLQIVTFPIKSSGQPFRMNYDMTFLFLDIVKTLGARIQPRGFCE